MIFSKNLLERFLESNTRVAIKKKTPLHRIFGKKNPKIDSRGNAYLGHELLSYFVTIIAIMQGHNCSFIIKHCEDNYVDQVQYCIGAFCNNTADCNLINIILQPNLYADEDECANIMYVNLYNQSNRTSLINYICNELNTEMRMKMVCKEQGNTNSVQFTLLVNSFDMPEIDELMCHFEKFGNCEISNYSTRDSVKTFVNYRNFEDAKEAYLETKICGLKIGNIVAHPVPIKYTRMLLAFEKKLSKDKLSIIADECMGLQYVHDFVDEYKNNFKFDMSKENDKKLTEACSRFVQTFFDWSYNTEIRIFNRGGDVYIDDNSAWEFLENAKNDVDAGTTIPTPVALGEVFDHRVPEVTITTSAPINTHEVVPVRRSIFDLMNKDLDVLETDLFGTSIGSKNNAKDRIVHMEEFLDLPSQGLDVQERLIKIKEKVTNFSTYYKNVE